MDTERIVIDLGKDKMAVLSVQSFDGDISEDVIKIDYSNLLGEIITFPVVFNRIANMRAEVSNLLGHAKLKAEIQGANLYQTHYKALLGTSEKSRGPAIKDVDMAVLRDPKYKLIQEELLQRQKDFEYCDALYWSAQSKDRKLNVLAERITPQEFEKDLVEGAINGVMIRIQRKAISSPRKK
jgi:hypothetical protein